MSTFHDVANDVSVPASVPAMILHSSRSAPVQGNEQYELTPP
jgi:hypothetical protein